MARILPTEPTRWRHDIECESRLKEARRKGGGHRRGVKGTPVWLASVFDVAGFCRL